MALRPGTQVGSYRIDAPLGAGGMGEVYRATDTKLDRSVAIKMVSGEFADAGRLARFEREARMLAALNHPHIATLFGWEPLDGSGGTMLVMELVDGPTLEMKLARGALPLPEVLRIAGQIADAVGSAHDQGIVHRDLKPANIKLTASGAVKVLDFGIAKAVETAQAAAITATLTEAGQIVGTSAYMSPEQTRGVAIDARTDVWAFGCVLFEMLTGRRAFDGATRSDVSAAVLGREPDWMILPANISPALRMLLRRCLEKELNERFRSMADARMILADLGGAGAAEAPTSVRRPLAPLMAATAGVAAVLAALGTWYAMGQTPAPAAQATTHFTISLGAASVNESDLPLALSPDGSKLVVSLGSFEGSHLYLR
jgi:serine/threonine protein kinase